MYAIFVKVCSSSRCIHFDFVDVVKACERNLYGLYVDPITSYGHVVEVFQIFLVIVHHSYDPLYMAWISKSNFGVEYLRFQFFSRTYMVHKMDVLIGCLSYVSRLDWLNVVEVVKQYSATIIGLIQELE
jgi:hypothetical protein